MDTRTKKNQFDERKQDWLVQKFGLWQPQRFDAIQAKFPFLLLYQEDEIKGSSQGAFQYQKLKYKLLKY